MNALGNEDEAISVAIGHEIVSNYGFTSSKVIIVPNRESVFTRARLGTGCFFGNAPAEIPKVDMFARYETGAVETICCVWKTDNYNSSGPTYARQLLLDYKRQLNLNCKEVHIISGWRCKAGSRCGCLSTGWLIERLPACFHPFEPS